MRPLLIAALSLFVLLQPAAGTAQHDHHSSPKLSIPSSLQIEHAQIHEELSALLRLGGKTGEAAKAVADALHEHFEAEEEFAMPPLGALQDLAMNVEPAHKEDILKMAETLERRMPEMLAEHKVITQKIEALRVAARFEAQPAAMAFADKLQLHAQNEEQILYPSAILIGKYIKLTTPARKIHNK